MKRLILPLVLFCLVLFNLFPTVLAAPGVTITTPLNGNTYGPSVDFNASAADHNSLVSVLDSSLIAWWPLNNNGSGGLDLTDKSGNSNTLTNFSATYFASGKLGAAAQFSGSSQYLRAGSSVTLTTKGAISAWAYADGFRASANPRILGNPANSYGQILLQDGTHKLCVYTQSNDMVVTDYVFPADSAWHFVLFNWGPSGGDLYVDNVSVWHTDSAVTLNSSSFTPEIGYGIATDWWTGKIDDVMYFNNTLTSDEITALFNGTAVSHTATLSLGSHTYKIHAQDASGVITSSATNTFTVSSVTPTPTSTPTPTNTPTPTPTNTPIPTPTNSPTPTPTQTPTPQPTPTITLTPVPNATLTLTPTNMPTATNTPLPTAVIDLTPPDLYLDWIGSVKCQTNSNKYYYNQLNPTLKGRGEVGVTVSMLVDDVVVIKDVVIDQLGNWLIRGYDFKVGTNHVQVKAVDRFDNQSLIAFTLIADPTEALFPQWLKDRLAIERIGVTVSPTVVPTLVPTITAAPTLTQQSVSATPVVTIAPTSEPTLTPTPPIPTDIVSEGFTPGIQGNRVTVKITDQNNLPLVGIEVTIASDNPITAITDEQGVATFENIWPGDHEISFVYDGTTVERAVRLLNDEENFKIDFQVTINSAIPLWIWVLIGGLVLLLLGLIIFLLRRREKDNSSSTVYA